MTSLIAVLQCSPCTRKKYKEVGHRYRRYRSGPFELHSDFLGNIHVGPREQLRVSTSPALVSLTINVHIRPLGIKTAAYYKLNTNSSIGNADDRNDPRLRGWECGSEIFTQCMVQTRILALPHLHFKALDSDQTFPHWFCPW